MSLSDSSRVYTFFPGIVSRGLGQVDPWAVLMVGIATFFSLLILAPLIVVFWLSFFEGSLLDPVTHYSFNNYVKVFTEPFTYKVLWTTAASCSSRSPYRSFSACQPRGWSSARTFREKLSC